MDCENRAKKSFVQSTLNFFHTSNSSAENRRSISFKRQNQLSDHKPRKRAKCGGVSGTKEIAKDKCIINITETCPDEETFYNYFGDQFGSDSSTHSSTVTQSTFSPFSIHRLPVAKLQRKFQQKLNETEIIDEIIRQVNTKYGYSREHFEKRVAFSENHSYNITEESSSLGSQPSTYGFEIAVYVQKVYEKDHFLDLLDISENHVRINKIIFYHRPCEIFAVTVGVTWQVIQPYSCYDFPYEISGRLTSAEGSLQETLKPLTGNIRSSKTTKKNASFFDQLNNVRYNVVKQVRPDSSIYWLREFSWEDKTATKIRFGLAYIRIEKCIKPGNIPEILHHFSAICNRESTLTFPDMDVEKHVDDLPMIRPVPYDESKSASEYLYKLVFSFMHNHKGTAAGRIHDFDFSHKHVEDFCLASDFHLKYDNGKGVSYTIKEFFRCPTTFQVFSSLRGNCRELAVLDYAKFKTRIAGNVKITYNLNGRQCESKVWDLLEGDVSIEQHGDFCRILGQWCTVRDEYYFQVHKKFLDLLRKDTFLLYPGEKGHLSQKWNVTRMRSSKEYVQSFNGIPGYFLPTFNSTNVPLFNLMYVSHDHEREQNTAQRVQLSLYLYYIFDRFDAGIRDSSTRVLKSLEAMFSTDCAGNASGKIEESILYQFYEGQGTTEFKSEFPTFELFQKQLLYGNVFIVVAFITENWRIQCKQVATRACQNTRGIQPITNYFTGSSHQLRSFSCDNDNEDNRIRSFYHERTLQLHFNVSNVKSLILKRLSECCRKEIHTHLEVALEDEQKLAEKLLYRLLELGYCTETGDSLTGKPISGKLLKMRNCMDFQLFPSSQVDLNKQVFQIVQRNFITQFPGFIHKLECFRIHENVMQWPRINLRFSEIALD